MSLVECQMIVDDLGRRLNRAAALDDTEFRLQAYSPHYGRVDDARLGSVLHKQASPTSIAWVRSAGLAGATSVVRLPGSPDGVFLARVASPVVCQGRLLGYLFMMDADESMTDADLDLVAQAADQLGTLLLRNQLSEDLARAREREWVRDLVSPDEADRRRAAAELAGTDALDPDRAVVCLVERMPPVVADGAQALREAFDTALYAERRGGYLAPFVHLVRSDHALVVASLARHIQRADLARWARRLLDTLANTTNLASGVVVGISDASPLSDVRIAYRQAVRAAQIAEMLRREDIAMWSDLGVYRVIANLPQDELSSESLHPAVRRLLELDASQALLETLELFLDLAGNVQAAADALHVHRSTLYQRLDRVQRMGVDLHDGSVRLELHLSLKIARLTGRYTPHPAERTATSDITEAARNERPRVAPLQMAAND